MYTICTTKESKVMETEDKSEKKYNSGDVIKDYGKIDKSFADDESCDDKDETNFIAEGEDKDSDGDDIMDNDNLEHSEDLEADEVIEVPTIEVLNINARLLSGMYVAFSISIISRTSEIKIYDFVIRLPEERQIMICSIFRTKI